ncbi:MAG TPA: hypothetical protein VGA13_02330 [Acidimicrobiales bacterium]
MKRLLTIAAATVLTVAGLAAVPTAQASLPGPLALAEAGCDPIDPGHCMLPFPSDWYTVDDGTTDTGRRVDFQLTAMPQNIAGKPIDPTAWNLNDGFSPGTPAIALVPGLDLHQTWGTADLDPATFELRRVEDRDHLADIARYSEPDAPILVINADTGERHPFWSELDTHPETTDDRRTLLIRPAVNYTEGAHYLVVLRNLKDGSGAPIDAADVFPTFAAFRDGTPLVAETPAQTARRADIESILTAAAEAEGPEFDVSEVVLAWEFTVASRRNLTEPVLHMRDETFGGLGDTTLADGDINGVPPTVRDIVVDDTSRSDRRVISGLLEVPNYMTHEIEVENEALPLTGQAAVPFYRLYDPDGDGIPERNPLQPTIAVPFDCQIPTGATGLAPYDLVQYGHGLLGSRGEAFGGSNEDLRANGFAICATDWLGMSGADVPNVVTILADLSNFPSLAERSQQGFLAKMLLSRWMAHPEGFAALAEAHDENGPRVSSGAVEYVGNSQGAIMGGSLVALSPDFRRGVLGVPGMNYSTLLNRSVDFEGVYSIPLYVAYPDKAEQQIAFAMMQMLWDRAETNGYAAFATTGDESLDTPSHQIMLQVAFADHQVANISAEVEARTMGASIVSPLLPDDEDGTGAGNDLHWSVDPLFGFSAVTFAPDGVWRDSTGSAVNGSALVYWYGKGNGNATPPNGNVPPTDGADPHEHPRRDNSGSLQVAEFLRSGELIDVCEGGPCITTAETRAGS